MFVGSGKKEVQSVAWGFGTASIVLN